MHNCSVRTLKFMQWMSNQHQLLRKGTQILGMQNEQTEDTSSRRNFEAINGNHLLFTAQSCALERHNCSPAQLQLGIPLDSHLATLRKRAAKTLPSAIIPTTGMP